MNNIATPQIKKRTSGSTHNKRKYTQREYISGVQKGEVENSYLGFHFFTPRSTLLISFDRRKMSCYSFPYRFMINCPFNIRIFPLFLFISLLFNVKIDISDIVTPCCISILGVDFTPTSFQAMLQENESGEREDGGDDMEVMMK